MSSHSSHPWRIAFFILSGLAVIAILVYVILQQQMQSRDATFNRSESAEAAAVSEFLTETNRHPLVTESERVKAGAFLQNNKTILTDEDAEALRTLVAPSNSSQ